MYYTKLSKSILTSTIWMENDNTRIVWIALLAMADKNGEVQASIPGLANVARVSVEACEDAINKFLAPDPYSRTKTDEGRRIEVIKGGWSLINHDLYKRMASDEDRKEQSAIRQARLRERRKRNALVTENSYEVTQEQVNVTAKSRQISHRDRDRDRKVESNTHSPTPLVEQPTSQGVSVSGNGEPHPPDPLISPQPPQPPHQANQPPIPTDRYPDGDGIPEVDTGSDSPTPPPLARPPSPFRKPPADLAAVSEIQRRINSLYRQPDRHWSQPELYGLHLLLERGAEKVLAELSTIESHFSSLKPDDRKYFPNSTLSLIEKWGGMLDRISMNTSKPRKYGIR